MKHELILLRDEIEEELANIAELKRSVSEITSQELSNEVEKRVTASLLNDFYLAAERIFKRIAKELDGGMPEGEEWHKTLLRQMSVDLPEVRPYVINKVLYTKLEEYLKFRHLVRNIYGFQLDYRRFRHLVNELDNVSEEFENQVLHFLNIMTNIASSY
ncbi:MAG: hypothetical protein KGZ56_04990 [Dethiobacter sp.]|nr:hypothetical protein [Dethiobacter sp.]MBS3897630.1 hypothetical protein [Dethiobacter sp.]